jgi:shikimate dehydrogenase
MTISGKAKLAGLIGWPVAHSLSPRLHGYWLAAHAIDGAYIPLAVQKDDFQSVVAALQKAGFAGVNVTIPHKETASALAHELDDAAKMAGAVNLLLFAPDGKIVGRNTDIGGLSASLAEDLGRVSLQGKKAVIVGAGGAARAAVLALAELGANDIRLVARDESRAHALLAALEGKTSARLRSFGWAAWSRAAEGVALMLNATSAGMAGDPPLDLPLDPLPVSAAVCDVVYNPLETDLLARAASTGHRAIDGLGMLMHQAVPAFAAFYGETPKVTPALRADLKKALRHG